MVFIHTYRYGCCSFNNIIHTLLNLKHIDMRNLLESELFIGLSCLAYHVLCVVLACVFENFAFVGGGIVLAFVATLVYASVKDSATDDNN